MRGKTKQLKNPIYPVDIWIHIGRNWDNFHRKYYPGTGKKGFSPEECYGFSTYIEEEYKGIHITLLPDITPGQIAHEAKHAVNFIYQFIGKELDLENDEDECYLLQWLVDEIYKVKESIVKDFTIQNKTE